MSAEESLRKGNLEESLAQLQQQVRSDPSNAKHRVFLFQLLAILGQWDRALNQLNVAAELDASTLAMAQTYRTALGCESLRAEVFAGRRGPLVFGEPEPWVALLLQALRLTAQGNLGPARELRDQAFEAAPAPPGTIDGTPFEWLADADTRLGPVLEAVVNGAYYWIPFHRIREIRIEKPEDLRDAVWMPAQFTWSNGGENVGLIPTRYPGSEVSPDGSIRLARKTEWLERAAGVYLGSGQRMFATDAGEYPLMDVRRVEIGGGGQRPGATDA